MTLSVIIIAKNEEQMIRDCLQSVSWADEIIVVDSGSTDRTVAICHELGAKVHGRDWTGFGPQKNRALDLATGDWVLSLDADERISAELCKTIQSVLANPEDNVAFRLPRSSSYCGRIMRHSGWWPDYVTRLFKRGHARFSDDLVHERLIVNGKTGTLKQPLLHEAFRDLEQVLQKLNSYSSAGAAMLSQRGGKASLASAVGHGLWTFIRTYFLRAGFLDGREGFMLAVSNAEGAYYRYLKAMLLQEKNAETKK
jgi:glycosyltransferase involved in cell wall biosynthesis